MLNLAIDYLAIIRNNRNTTMARSPEDEKIIREFRSVFETVIKERGWNQAKICRAIGRSAAWLSRILSGDRGMDVLDLIKIANILKINPGKLLPLSVFNKETEDEETLKRLRDAMTPELFNKLIKMEPKKIGG